MDDPLQIPIKMQKSETVSITLFILISIKVLSRSQSFRGALNCSGVNFEYDNLHLITDLFYLLFFMNLLIELKIFWHFLHMHTIV